MNYEIIFAKIPFLSDISDKNTYPRKIIIRGESNKAHDIS